MRPPCLADSAGAHRPHRPRGGRAPAPVPRRSGRGSRTGVRGCPVPEYGRPAERSRRPRRLAGSGVGRRSHWRPAAAASSVALQRCGQSDRRPAADGGGEAGPCSSGRGCCAVSWSSGTRCSGGGRRAGAPGHRAGSTRRDRHPEINSPGRRRARSDEKRCVVRARRPGVAAAAAGGGAEKIRAPRWHWSSAGSEGEAISDLFAVMELDDEGHPNQVRSPGARRCGDETGADRHPLAEHRAYAIFTSGSTGEPKGVAITHDQARTTIDAVVDRFRFGPDDRVLGVSALTFDLSVFDALRQCWGPAVRSCCRTRLSCGIRRPGAT